MPRDILKKHPSFLELKERHPKVKCFIFDMDGTLLDSENTHSQAVKQLLENNGQLNITIDWINQTFVGLADTDVFDYLILNKYLKVESISLEEFISQKNKAFKEILPSIPKQILLHKKIEDFLFSARSLDYKTALVTASEGFITTALMGHIGGSNLFDIIKSREDFILTKPHPMPYIKTIDELGFDLDEVIIFEDSTTGIKSAVDSGAIVYQANWH